MKAEALFHAKVDTLAYVEAMTLNDSLAKVNAEALMDALACTLPDVEVMTLIYSFT